jgi:uncharacterized protein (UPF0335 family)
MCLATDILNEQIEGLVVKRNKLNEDVSKVDKKLSEFYHGIEAKKFNACEGFYIAKDLQKILRQRRNIKFQHMQISQLVELYQNNLSRLKKNEKKYFSVVKDYYHENTLMMRNFHSHK